MSVFNNGFFFPDITCILGSLYHHPGSSHSVIIEFPSLSAGEGEEMDTGQELTCLDVPDYGLLNDLVWSDPSDTALDWEDNERGVSFCYGKSVINSFLATHVS